MGKPEVQSGSSPSFSSKPALSQGHEQARSGRQSSTAATAAAASTGYRGTPSTSSSLGPSASGGVLDNRLAPRPRRYWESASQASNSGKNRSPAAAAGAGARAGGDRCGVTTHGAMLHGGETLASLSLLDRTSCGRDSGVLASGADFSRNAKMGAGGTSFATSDANNLPAATSSRAGGTPGSDDDLTDTDEGVMARLAEFTEMTRRTAVHNEELCRELADEKRRVAHTTRKLEQSQITCNELRESLALAQDTVMKLRDHEIAWAESTASEMSLKAEMCALKDEYGSVSGEVSVLRKRCEMLQRENAELVERFAKIAEEKRQVESRARRLLSRDRYRGY